MTDYDSQVRLFKTLSHPARLAILNVLREREACVCHLEAALGYRQAYISQQLMVLRDAGLVQDRRDGWNVFYHVTRQDVYKVINAAQQALGHVYTSRTTKLPNCPCPYCHPETELASC